jgi:hypothetical protein
VGAAPGIFGPIVGRRATGRGPWGYTDDSAMLLAVALADALHDLVPESPPPIDV